MILLKKLLLVVVLLLVGLLVLPQGVLAETGIAALSGTVPVSLSLLCTGSDTMEPLNYANTPVHNDTASSTMNITPVSNAPWQLTAYDALTTSKPAGSEGKMVEWVTDQYIASSPKVFSVPLKIYSTGSSFVNLGASGAPVTIQTGDSNNPDGTPVFPRFEQPVAQYEKALASANTYHIIVTFSAVNT